MKAAILHAQGDLRVGEIARPDAGPGEVLVKVAYCGVCGSDVPRLIKDGAHYYPIVLGHEFSGIIEAVGEGVDSSLVGRKTACAPLIPNFAHPQSIKGNYALGSGYSFIGSRRQGGYAEYVTMPLINAVLLPEHIDLLLASLMEPLTVGLHAINIMGFTPGRAVAVTGVGTIGLLLVQSLRAMGAGTITVFDVDDAKLATARAMGADFGFNSRRPEAADEAVAQVTGGEGFATVFETAGVPAAEILALRLAGAKAHVMFVGTPHVPLVLEPSQFEMINRKELNIQGSWMNYSAPFPGWEWDFGGKALANGKVIAEGVIDRVIPLSEAAIIPTLLSNQACLKGKLTLDCGA
jgi:threonine dehydrogenase-like Zn-dependent dehydrogenase